MYKKIIISLLPSIPLYAWWVFLVTSDPVHIFGFLSYFYFILTLWVSPISYILSKNNSLKSYVNFVISLRRPLWILTGIFAFLHVIKFYEHVLGIYEKFFASSQSLFEFVLTSLSWVQWNVFWMNTLAFWLGTLGLIIMTVLLSTSNNYSQNLLGSKNWKRLQVVAYPLFIIMVAHIYFIGWWKGAYLYPAIILFLIRFYSWFDKNFSYRKRTTGPSNWYRRFLCPPCWFIYDEELWDEDGWLPPWTKYEDIPDDWVCPVCWAAKKDFVPLDDHYNPEQWEDHELNFTVVSKKFLTPDVIELQLSCEKDLNILPWQFCKLIFESDGEKYMRSYSISLYRDKVLTFLIKLKDGWVAWEILKSIKEGSDLQWIWPFWNFILQNTSRKKIFIATGTGVSPIYNMMHASWDTQKVLYFWVRKQSNLFYIEELAKIPNLTIHIYLSQEESTEYNFGRIEYSKIKYTQEDEIYLCWSPWLVEDLQSEFKKQWKSNIFLEKFL